MVSKIEDSLSDKKPAGLSDELMESDEFFTSSSSSRAEFPEPPIKTEKRFSGSGKLRKSKALRKRELELELEHIYQ